MPVNLTNKTNDELMSYIEAGPEVSSLNYAGAINEMKNRLAAAEYGLYKGFEHPANPPGNP